MPFTKFTNLNFAEIKESVKDYLRANSDFKDFDFEGSNMSIIVDIFCLLYTSPSPRDKRQSRMPSSA